MSRLLKLLKAKPFCLIVSLPANEIEMAEAAQQAGADAVKLHIDLWHRASGHNFLSLEEERDNIKRILHILNIPAGIVPGSKRPATGEELEELKSLGIDFIDIFIHHAPSYYLKLDDLGCIYAIDEHYRLLPLSYIERLGADALEASIFPFNEYGTRLSVADIINYQSIVESVNIPVVVPTQKKIEPEEIRYLKEAGVKAIMIGAVVTGNSVETIAAKTRDFRQEIDKLV